MEVSTWIGLDVAKADHHATVVDQVGSIVFDRAVKNDQAAIERLLEDAGENAVLVIDQPGRSARSRSPSPGAAGSRSHTSRGW